MENTIMTEKIARRGIYTPDAYEPDILRRINIFQVLGKGVNNLQQQTIAELLKKEIPILKTNEPLSRAVEFMASTGEECLPIASVQNPDEVIGLLSYKDIFYAYKLYHQENQEAGINLSLKRQRLKMMIRSRKLIDKTKS